MDKSLKVGEDKWREKERGEWEDEEKEYKYIETKPICKNIPM